MAKGEKPLPRKSLAASLKPEFTPPAERVRKARLAELSAAAAELGAGPDISKLVEDKPVAAFVAAVMDASPFLRALILDDPARLAGLMNASPQKSLAEVERLVEAAANETDEADLMARLRRARGTVALLVALADLGGVWDVDTVMASLTAFADSILRATASFVLRAEQQAGRMPRAQAKDLQIGSGWIILAMGKQGAGELNYSSDIDLIVLFDPIENGDDDEPAKLYVRMTRRLIHILQERTPDGYVFRTDLRLRPDPGSTAVAVSVPAALLYYESQGQNWERAAFVKARAVAGDIAAGEAFLARLVPFLWRKYLDYAAIADIHSIKRQIHDFRGHETIAIAGHNLKLGRGGIREIEFFVQTQQLIAGGRSPGLRGRRTLEMLAELAADRWIEPSTADELVDAYRFLRRIEHRLQMIADEQTHSLPSDKAALTAVARLCGYRGLADFERALRPVLETVQHHYAHLFESAPSLTSATGSLVFTGEDDDPDTIETLSRLGYSDPGAVIRTVRGWHHGRYVAMRSATARERLTEVTPALLETLAKTDNADAAFLAFDRFFGRLPAGLQLFALVTSNPRLLHLLARILGTAPRLADIVTRRPHVLDALIDPAFFGSLPERETLAAHLEQTLAQAVSYEDALDRARIFGQEQSFLIGVRALVGRVDARQAGAAYTDLADLLVAEALRFAEASVVEAHGKMPGGSLALIAMGKLGGREMTASSDLDLILLYSVPKRTTGSDGRRPLAPGAYYTRVTQRLVAALSAPTAEGTLYEVDFRLRPSGNSGPLATSLDAFSLYQQNEAWTWEHLALTRARPIAGNPRLMDKAARTIDTILRLPRDKARVTADILEMRGLVEQEKGGGGIWDLKQVPGGMLDIEFIAQYLQLLSATEHPTMVSRDTEGALRAALDCGALPPPDGDILLPALKLYQDLTQIIRLCVGDGFEPGEATGALKELLAVAAELPDFKRLEAHLADTETAVRGVFTRVIGKVPRPKNT